MLRIFVIPVILTAPILLSENALYIPMLIIQFGAAALSEPWMSLNDVILSSWKMHAHYVWKLDTALRTATRCFFVRLVNLLTTFFFTTVDVVVDACTAGRECFHHEWYVGNNLLSMDVWFLLRCSLDYCSGICNIPAVQILCWYVSFWCDCLSVFC